MTIIQKLNANILQPIIQILFAVAIGYFFYGVMKFVMNQDNDEAQEEGKKHMLWGIVGIAIMFSVYGILNFINSTVGVVY